LLERLWNLEANLENSQRLAMMLNALQAILGAVFLLRILIAHALSMT